MFLFGNREQHNVSVYMTYISRCS